MAESGQERLGAVQQTLFIPLAARARAAQRRRPVLRDPKAVQIAGSVEIDAKYGRGAFGSVTVLRTVILDTWSAPSCPGTRQARWRSSAPG